jgi:hypothetical protein
MNSIFKTLAMAFVLLTGLKASAQKEEVCYNPNLVKDTTKKSIKSVAEGKIGTALFTINYHSPGVRKRIIWGGLVPFDEVWVTGAHNATSISFDKAVRLNGKMVKAGKYALFTIPSEKEWTVIINKDYDQHLATEYDEKGDVVRLSVKPQAIPHLERLQYFIEPKDKNSGTLAVAWEKVRINIPVTIVQE